MTEETAIIGWDNIGRLFGRSGRYMRKKYREELLEYGVLFYQHLGRPPQRRACAFPSCLRKWAGLKGQKDEMI